MTIMKNMPILNNYKADTLHTYLLLNPVIILILRFKNKTGS